MWWLVIPAALVAFLVTILVVERFTEPRSYQAERLARRHFNRVHAAEGRSFEEVYMVKDGYIFETYQGVQCKHPKCATEEFTSPITGEVIRLPKVIN